MSPAILDALNAQIRYEFSSSHAYLALSAFFDLQSLPGFAHWMRIQHDEEQRHALRIFDFILLRNAMPQIQAVDAPAHPIETAIQALEVSLQQERSVTASITDLYELAISERDHATQIMLQWFIQEQLEEERSVEQVLDQMRMAGDSSSALLLIDAQLSRRTLGPDTAATGA